MHLCCGQEAIPVGACRVLEERDALTVTYRGHGWVLARGVPAAHLFAELMGRRSPLCGGRGGLPPTSPPRHTACSARTGSSAPESRSRRAPRSREAHGRRLDQPCLDRRRRDEPGRGARGAELRRGLQLPLVVVVENNVYSELTPIRDDGPAPRRSRAGRRVRDARRTRRRQRRRRGGGRLRPGGRPRARRRGALLARGYDRATGRPLMPRSPGATQARGRGRARARARAARPAPAAARQRRRQMRSSARSSAGWTPRSRRPSAFRLPTRSQYSRSSMLEVSDAGTPGRSGGRAARADLYPGGDRGAALGAQDLPGGDRLRRGRRSARWALRLDEGAAARFGSTGLRHTDLGDRR